VIHELRDGTRILVRPLEPGDRDELARAYARLSPASRRLRFFNPADALSPDQLDYLTHVDHQRHDAIVAVVVDDEDQPQEGVGVARWVRLVEEPTKAEVAVTVLDEYQRRGVATLLLGTLAERAIDQGITTFVARVLWENLSWLESLRALGARVEPDEPGVAKLEFDLTLPREEHRPLARRVLQELGAFMAELRARAEADRSSRE
jgi:GNAT superfamily N-acetyltransferase